MYPREDDESLNLKILGPPPPPLSIEEERGASWSTRESLKWTQVTAAPMQAAKWRFRFGQGQRILKKTTASGGLAKRQRIDEGTACGPATTSAPGGAAATKEQRNTMPRQSVSEAFSLQRCMFEDLLGLEKGAEVRIVYGEEEHPDD